MFEPMTPPHPVECQKSVLLGNATMQDQMTVPPQPNTVHASARQPAARAWNPLPDPDGRGLYDGTRGREVTPAVRRWRSRINKVLLAAGVKPDHLNETRSKITEDVLTLTSVLQSLHGTPSLGDHAHPLRELLFLAYEREGKASDGGIAALLAPVLATSYRELLNTDHPALSGLSEAGRQLFVTHLNHISHEHTFKFFAKTLRALPDAELLPTLLALPNLPLNDALRLMLYTFGRDTFPITADSLRVLQRTGVLDSTGADLRGLTLQEAQAQVQDLVPPNLRGVLHVNAAIHGQQVCGAQKPDCSVCPIKLLCKTGRAALKEQADGEQRLSLVDMFCGAGGLSEGFRQAGFRTVMAVDADPQAMRTYRLNHPEVDEQAMLCRDIRGFRDEAENIRALIGEREIDVLVGGPPCQGFSRAGLRAKPFHGKEQASQDERNHLYKELVDLLEVLRPRAVVLENVPGMGEVTYTDDTTFVQAARAAMEDADYQTTSWLLNAAAYGVAQERIRRIIVGVRDGPAPVQPPAATHNAATTQHRVDTGRERTARPDAITLGERLNDLPPLQSAQGKNITGQDGKLLTGHVSRFQNKEDLKRYRALKQGENYRNLIVRRPKLKCYSDDHFPDKFYKLSADRPSRTIVAHLQRDGNSFVHPTQPRSITPREAARLQSFGDDYLFTGPLTGTFRQIGNAVPPLLARAIAEHLRIHLEQLEQPAHAAD